MDKRFLALLQASGMDTGMFQDMLEDNPNIDPKELLIQYYIQQQLDEREMGEGRHIRKQNNRQQNIRKQMRNSGFRQKLQERVNELVEEVAELRQRNEAFTAALGYCPNCLGEDTNCSICQGHGNSRNELFEIDDELFRLLILPAVERYYGLSGLDTSIYMSNETNIHDDTNEPN